MKPLAIALFTLCLIGGCARSGVVPGPAGELHVDDGGAGGIPVLLVHSFAGNTTHWNAQLEHLRKSRRAIALDLRGHGRSAPPTNNDYSLDALAQDIGAVADGLGLKRFVLVGHSMGGAASLAYAGKNPDRVAGLVLAGAPGKLPPEQAEKIMRSLESDYDRTMQAYWDQLLTDARPPVRAQLTSEKGSLSPGTSIRIIRSLFRHDPLPALERYRGPKLAIVPAKGEVPHDLHVLVPQLPARRIADTSHWFHMDKPEEFNQLLDEFLAAIR